MSALGKPSLPSAAGGRFDAGDRSPLQKRGQVRHIRAALPPDGPAEPYEHSMESYIHHIATRVPRHAYAQEYARDRMKGWVSNERARRLVHSVYGRSGIARRHSVIGDFATDTPELFTTQPDGSLHQPTTGERNRLYARESRPLAVELARDLLAHTPEFAAREVTHVVFASCTGFANPGCDYHLVRELGLASSVERYTLGFMGCYAAFPALRMADQFCRANPEAVVLVMCLELCSLHLQINDEPDSLLANSLFADGAAAALVSARPPAPDRPHFRIGGFASALLPSGEEAMAWDIGDHGFDIVLSSYVPDIIGANVGRILDETIGRWGRDPGEIARWAVHPGGRSILDKISSSLTLPADALDDSRAVLRDYGNMSSATVLFVLQRMLAATGPAPELTCAMAFGPGLTVETALLELSGNFASAIPVASEAASPASAA